ncbi:MAG: AMP-binding protein, partial [Deltaproteobacteria bacterium]
EAIVNHTRWMQDDFPLGISDAVLQKTPLGFDASVWEFWSPLCAGAHLVMAAPGAHRDVLQLVRAVQKHDITTLQIVPSMLRALLDDPGFSTCVTLKRVFCGGEALSGAARDEFRRRFEGRELVNLYGPTEATIDTLFHAVPRSETGAAVPVGRPVANVRAEVMDARMQPVPVGVSGELYLGGVQLARGYHGRSDLTAERFVPDPRGNGERLYRTGDLARWRPDGAIDYVGRADFQVKVRGFRIELGEIEVAVLKTGWARECVVTSREDVAGDKRLVAYLVSPDGQSRTPAELRDSLKRSLPEYMVPSAFVWLDAMPLTTSGKTDRRALPAPDAGAGAASEFVAPRNDVEKKVAEILSAALHVERVGMDDDFFALGGHSLLATQVISRVRTVFKVEISLKDVFERPSAAGMAAAVTRARAQGARKGPITEVTTRSRIATHLPRPAPSSIKPTVKKPEGT